jgi:hypothetical protein
MQSPRRLVFIEGLPGSGKSTAAQRLAFEGGRQGRVMHWYYEQDAAHPLAGYFEPRQGGDALPFMAQARARWHSFARNATAGTHLVESHLFQGPIGSLLLQDVPPPVISAFVGELMQAVTPLAPRLIRLVEADARSALGRIIAFRWGALEDNPYIRRFDASPYARAHGLHGFSGYVAFCVACADLAQALVATTPWPVLEVPAATDVAAQRQRLAAMCDFLGLSDPTAERYDLQAYAGIYALPDGGHFTITCDSQGLLVLGHPRLWRAGNRLLQRAPARFLVVSWPFDAVFESDGEHGVAAMTFADDQGTPFGERFQRMHSLKP